MKWPRRFDSYVDDNLPNRSILLRLNSWVKFHVFATSPVDNVLVGKQGWLFHRTPADLLEVEGRLERKPYQIRRLRVVLEERRDWLAERGIDYLVLIAPTKQSIYPERLPQWVNPSSSGRSRRELLQAELQRAESNLKLSDFTPVLCESKGTLGDALL
jgi:alginate O-acetyltransferase complex protein AlgJ